MLGYALIMASVQSRWRNALFVSGAAAGMTVLIRTSAAIHVMTIGIFLLACLYIEKRSRRESLAAIGIWIAGLAPFALADRLFDYARYGSIFVTGQSMWLAHINSDPIFTGLPKLSPAFPFVNSAFTGVLNVFFSPAKSIFIYDPLLLPCMITGALAWRSLSPYVRWFAATALLNIALHIGLTSKLDFWHGDWAWAARYHLSSVELLLVCLLPLFIQRALQASGMAAIAMRGLLALGFLVQLLAVSMPANIDIAPELLEEPTMCSELWNTRLEFRLWHRIKDLYCYASNSTSSDCPAAIGDRAERTHATECADTINEIRRSNHLAFAPFDPSHQLADQKHELAAWVALMALTLLWTSLWIYRRILEFGASMTAEAMLRLA